MVKKCLLCKKYSEPDSGRSFHKFPYNPELRKTWLYMLGLKVKDDISLKYSILCSDHFSSNDFIVKPSGVKYLKKGAVPSIGNTSKIPVQFDIVGSNKASTSSQDVEKLVASDVRGCEEILVSTTEVEMKSPEISILKMPTKLEHSRYFGDCDTLDFDDPVKAKSYWNMSKTIITEQRKKIKSLNTTRKRLKTKIHNLTSLLTYLNKRNKELMANTSIGEQLE